MLANSLFDIKIIVILRSDKILLDLLSRHDFKSSSAFTNAMKDFYPNKFRKGSISLASKSSCNASIDRLEYDFTCLNEIYEEYFTRDGSYIEAKEQMLERYSALINKIHPYNVIGYRLAQELYSNEISFQNLTEYTGTITPLALSNNRNCKRYSDNHIHLSGANENIKNLLTLLNEPTETKYYDLEFISELPRIHMFSHINNGQLNIGNLIDLAKLVQNELHNFVIFGDEKCDDSMFFCEVQKLLKGFSIPSQEVSWGFDFIEKSRILETSKLNMSQKLLKDIVCHYKNARSVQQWFLYNIFLHYLHIVSRNKHIRTMVKIFFHISNILRAYQVMNQNIGLSHFSEFSRSPVRQVLEKSANNIAANIISTGTQTFEVKTTTNALFNGGVNTFINSFDKHIALKKKHFPGLDHAYHFCLHFIRKEDRYRVFKELPVKGRHNGLRRDLKLDAHKLHEYLFQKNSIVSSSKKSKMSRPEEYIDMSKLITSLDVAGDETLAPPEVFAPIIRYLRNEPKKIHFNQYRNYLLNTHTSAHRKLKLSVHAGEDFNHIVTGMRRVDETIQYYEMEKDDRLGHALAVGLEPQQWLDRNGDIFLTKQELLDDFIWLVKQGEKIANHNTEFFSTIKKYEDFIHQLSTQIYNKSYSIMALHEAWKLRKFCPTETAYSSSAVNSEYIKIARPDSNSDKNALRIFKEYHFNSGVRMRGDEVITIKHTYKKDNSYNSINRHDIDLIYAIQDLMLEKIVERGIIIEANPTSNVYIAQLTSYREHPIFRWHPIGDKLSKYNKFGIRNTSVKVCINTDDPAIMPTTLRNEFYALRQAALAIHDDKKDIDDWLEEIRNLGNEVFDYNHQKFRFGKKV